MYLQERYVLKVHLQYNPELHRKQKSLIKESFMKKLGKPEEEANLALDKALNAGNSSLSPAGGDI